MWLMGGSQFKKKDLRLNEMSRSSWKTHFCHSPPSWGNGWDGEVKSQKLLEII